MSELLANIGETKNDDYGEMGTLHNIIIVCLLFADKEIRKRHTPTDC